MSGKLLWSFHKGNHCLYFKDGRFVAADKTSISMYNKDFHKVWSLTLPVHHQVNFNQAKDRILIISDTYHEYKGKKMRFDRLLVLDLHGKIIKDYDFFPHREEVNKVTSKERLGKFSKEEEWVLRNPEYPWEYSHVNSFYEVPKNLLEEKVPALKAGNYVVNVNEQNMVIILDKDLNQILWSLSHKIIGGGDEVFHDVQVLPSGEFLIYFNRDYRKKFSSIDLYHPFKKELTTLYKASPAQNFFSWICGGAQILENGNLLFSDTTNGAWAYEVDKNRKLIWSMHYQMIPKSSPQVYQQIKRADLTEFLKNNNGI